MLGEVPLVMSCDFEAIALGDEYVGCSILGAGQNLED